MGCSGQGSLSWGGGRSRVRCGWSGRRGRGANGGGVVFGTARSTSCRWRQAVMATTTAASVRTGPCSGGRRSSVVQAGRGRGRGARRGGRTAPANSGFLAAGPLRSLRRRDGGPPRARRRRRESASPHCARRGASSGWTSRSARRAARIWSKRWGFPSARSRRCPGPPTRRLAGVPRRRGVRRLRAALLRRVGGASRRGGVPPSAHRGPCRRHRRLPADAHEERVSLPAALAPDLPEERSKRYVVYSVLDAMLATTFDALEEVELTAGRPRRGVDRGGRRGRYRGRRCGPPAPGSRR